MIGKVIDTDKMEIAVSLSADGRHVEMTTSLGKQVMTPSDALGLSDALTHAAKEAQIDYPDDVIDHNTRWV